MDRAEELTGTFLAFSRRQLITEMWPRLCVCLDGLTEEQVWWRPNEASNSIGNLLLHLNGNIRQWVLRSLGGVPFDRDRDAEFAQRERLPVPELRARLEATLGEVDALLQRLSGDDLLRKHDIQAWRDVPALQAIYHVVEHFAMHYGQILYISKLVTGSGFDFYKFLNKSEASTR